MKTLVAFLISKMKTKIDGVIIVEGKADVAYLSSFLDTLYFVTNGYDLSLEKINFLKASSEVNKLIVFTDSDEAGEGIRKSLKNKINGVFEAKTRKKSRKSYHKTGVAEAEKNDVLEALKPYATNQEIFKENYDLVSLISLAENPSEIKEKIIRTYNLIKGNNKSLENQLRILKIRKEEVWKLIETTSLK